MEKNTDKYIRTKQERERDLVLIANLYLRGYTMAEISERMSEDRPYSLGVPAISREIKELYNRWQNSQIVSFNAAKSRELQRIDQLETAYWEAWERSVKDREEFFEQTVEDTINGTAGAYKRFKQESKKFLRDGSVEFLRGVERCIQERCKIMGLYSPDKLQIDWRTQAVQAGLDADDVQRQFEEMVNEYTNALARGDDGRGDSDSGEES